MNLNDVRIDLRYALGNITTTELSNPEADRLINTAYQRAISVAIRASGTWDVEGGIATTDLITGQQEYTLTTPVPLKTLSRVEINYTGEPDAWTLPEVVDFRQINYPLSNSTQSVTLESQVRLYDNSIFLLNSPSEDIVGGLKIWYSSEAADLKERFDCTVQEASGKYLTIGNIGNATGLIVTLSQNTSDVLSVTNPSSTSLLIKLANTTATLNTVSLIEDAIQALGTSNGINYYEVTCTGINWTSITGGTITTATDTAALTGYDTPNLYTENVSYLINYAAYLYCRAFRISDRTSQFKEDYMIDEEKIKVAYTNRLPFERGQFTAKQANYQ